MTVPCHRALVAFVVWPVNTNRPFPEFFAKVCKKPKMVSFGRYFVSSPSSGRNKAGTLGRRAATPKISMADEI